MPVFCHSSCPEPLTPKNCPLEPIGVVLNVSISSFTTIPKLLKLLMFSSLSDKSTLMLPLSIIGVLVMLRPVLTVVKPIEVTLLKLVVIKSPPLLTIT